MLSTAHPLVAAVRQVGVTGPVIDRRYAQRGEPGHIRPAVLGPHLPAGGLDQSLGGRLRQAGQRAGRGVGQLDGHVEPVEHLVHMRQRRVHRPVGGEAEVDGHRGRVGNHVAGHATVDAHGRQTLPILATVDVDAARPIRRQPVQHRAQLVNCVVAQPGTCRMRARSAGADHNSQRALTTGLDIARGGLAQDGHVGGQPVRQLALDATQTVCRRIDFLAVVEHQRQVVHRLGHGGRQMKEDRVTGFHVRGAAAVQLAALQAAGQVVGHRDGVQMSGQQHPRRPAQRSARQHGIAVADDLEAGSLRAQRGLHLVGDARLVPRLAGDVDQRRGQLDRIPTQIQHAPKGMPSRRKSSHFDGEWGLLCLLGQRK